MENLIEFVQNQFIRSQQRLRPYVWKNDWKYPQRPMVLKTNQLWKGFLGGRKDPRIMIIPGIRGVGKTTVLAQTYFALKESNQIKDPRGIVYISLDEVVNTFDCTLNDVFTAYEKIIGQNFEALDHQVVFFLDEVQYDPKWSNTLKVIRDRTENVLVFCSGSSAVSLNTNADLARRAIIEKLYPTSFPEYIMIQNNVFPITGMKEKLRSAIFDSYNAKEVYEKILPLQNDISKYWAEFDPGIAINQYLRVGTLPFTVLMKNEAQAFDRISEVLNRVLKDDIPTFEKFDSDTIPLFSRLLFILSDCSNLSLQGLSNAIGKSHPVITSMLTALEKAEILLRFKPYGSKELQVKQPSKYLFMSPAFRASYYNILTKPDTYKTKLGNLLEDVIGLYLYRLSTSRSSDRMLLYYDHDKDGADFIVNNLKVAGNLVFEVSLSDSKRVEQIKKTMIKTKALYGICLSASPLSLMQDENIVKIPLRTFLLA